MGITLVTGGAGFIGSNLIDHLREQGQEIRVLDNFSSGNLANLAQRSDHVTVIEGDITDLNCVRDVMRSVETVYHLAALVSVPASVRDPIRAHMVNATGTLNILEAARVAGVRRVVYAGSSAAYGDQPGDAKHEAMPAQPLSPYAASKLAGEHYCTAYSQSYGLETVVLRFFNVYGPRQDPKSEYSAVIPLFIARLLEDRPPTIYGDGLQSRDFVYVGDLVRALERAAAAPEEQVYGQVFNIGGGVPTTLLDLLQTLGTLTGKAAVPIHTQARTGDIRHSRAAIGKARHGLGWVPETSLLEGLRATLTWYQENDKTHVRA